MSVRRTGTARRRRNRTRFPWARRVRGRRGRGAYGKTVVFGIFERQGRVYPEIVPDCSKPTLQGSGYHGLVDLGDGHFRVDHSKDECVRHSVHINGIEGFWGMPKVRLRTLVNLYR